MLNIVMASSNEYSPLLLITLTSLLENNSKDFNFIRVYVFDDGINDVNKNKIMLLAEKYPCKINFIKIDLLNYESINLMPLDKDSMGLSLTTYSRLFISNLLPSDVDKIIYLDCDGIVIGSFKELWELDISKYYCAGVLDTLNENIQKFLGYSKEDNYINAGFLLINLKKWRKDNVEEKFIEFLSKNQGKYFMMDQGVINSVFRDNMKCIAPKYNLQNYFQYFNYNMAKKFKGIETEYYSKEIVDESRNNPVFLHFCGAEVERPWQNKYHKYNSEYIKYAKLAKCENVIDYIDPPTWKSKLLYMGGSNFLIRFVLNLIPFSVVKKIVDERGINIQKQEMERAKNIK